MSVTAYDNVGNNSGASSRSFEIDNTPPLFIISNPGVVKSENKEPSAYGSVFTVDGTIADNHEIASMDVEIYNEAGELLSKENYNDEEINSFREEEIPTAGGTSVQIAQYVEGDSNNRYSTLHPESSGTEYYYAKITLADATQVYQNPPKSKDRAADEQVEVLPEDLVGNKSSKFYLYDDVYTSLMSKKNGKGLSAAALKDIVSGIISDKATLADLANAEKDSSNEENYLCFSLNPEANPTYNISGFGYEYNNVYQSASCGNTVNITINSGLDNVAVNPGTVKVWLKEFDSIPEKEEMTKAIMELAGKVKGKEDEAGEEAIFDDETADEDKKIDDWSLIYDYSNYSGSSVSTKTFAITLPSKGIVLNKYYVLAVTGYDVDEVAFKQDAVYAFAGNVSGIAPTIEIKSPDNGSFVKAGEFSFEGTAVVNNADLNVKSLEATIKATNGTQAVGNEEGYSVKVTYDSTKMQWAENEAFAVVWNEEESVWKWTFTPSKIKDFLSETKDATKYALSIKGVSSSDHDVTMSSMVQLDITPPVVSINTITPIVEGKDFDGSANVYINGTVRIMGTIVEQNLKEVTYDIFAKTEDEDDFVSILEMMKAASQGAYSSDLFDGNLEQSNSIDISFPTTYLTAYYAQKTGKADPKITIKVTLMAEDIVGNKGEYTSTIYNKTLEYSDGRDFIIYQETDRPKITLDNADLEYKDDESGKTKSLLAKDGDDDPSTFATNNSNNINVKHNLFGINTNNVLQVSASDDDGLKLIRVIMDDVEHQEYVGSVNNIGKTTGSLKYTLPAKEGIYKVKVEAVDNNENPSAQLPTDLNSSFGYNCTAEFYIAVSAGAPSIEITKPIAGSNQSQIVNVEGNISKNDTIKSLKRSLQQGGVDVEAESSVQTPTGTTWSDRVVLPDTASGEYTLIYNLADKYGQTSSAVRTFSVDINPPTFEITSPEAKDVFTKESIFTVKGSISDGEGTSGIKGLYYSLKAQTASDDTYKPFNGDKLSDDWQQASVIAKEKGQFTWTANIDLTGISPTDGSESNTVYFAAIDEAGNISLISENSDSSSLKITRDTVAPSTTLLGSGLKKPADKVSENEKTAQTSSLDLVGNLILKDDSELEESLTYYANGSYTLSGLVTEVSPADVTITAKMGTNDLTVTRDETNSKKWSVVGGTDEGTHAYEITFTDKAGNSVTKKISVIKDSVKPTVTVSNETTDAAALVTKKLITEENTNHSVENGIHKYLLSGKWSDKTSGTSKLQYRVLPHKEGDSYVESYSDWRDISDVTTSTAESSWSFKVDMLEGYGLGTGVWMQGRAIDAAGNITYTEEYKNISVDFGKPAVTKTAEAPEYVAKDGTLTITGTVSDSYKLSSTPVTVVAKLDGTEVANGEKGFSFTQNVAEDTKTGTYTITVNASDSNNGTWTFEVKANDWAARESAALSFSTTVDTVAPAWNAIKVNNELYDSDADRTWYKNATLPFSGSLTETGSKVKEIQWSVIKAGASEPAEGDTGTVSPKADGSFNTNIGEFIAKKAAGGNAVANTVKLVAVDYAGNKSVEKTFNIYIDSEAPTLVKSNKDGTQFSNKDAALDVALEASDDASGVKSVTLSITLDGSTTPLEISSGKTTIEATETSGKWNATIPSTFLANLENKTYAVKAKIADNAKNTSDMTLFRIDVDDEKPTIGKLSVTNTNAKYSVYKSTTETETYFVHNGDGNKFEILGAVQDAKSGVERVELWKGNTKLAPTTNTAISSLPIADIDLSEFTDSATLTLKAFDNAGNVQTQDIVVNFDNDAPTFAITSTDERDIYTKENIYTVKGTISDGESTSGIKGMYYTLNAQTATDGAYSVLAENGSIASGWLAASVVNNGEGAYGWTANIDLSSISSVDGTKANTVYFAAVDEIGNVSVVSANTDSSIKITRDTVAPTSTLLGTGLKQSGSTAGEGTDEAGNVILAADSTLSEAGTYYATGSSYSLKGEITEASAAPLTITVKENGTAAVFAKDGTNWSITGESDDGTYSYEITVTDKAGNSVTKKVSVTKDTKEPTWNDGDIKVNKKAVDENLTWYKNATLPFTGSLTETGSKVKEIQWSVKQAGASSSSTGTFTPKADGTFDTNLGEFIAKKDSSGNAIANSVTLVAIDYAGNKSAEKTFNIFIDAEPPVLEHSNREGTQFSNKKLPFDIELEVSDNASGVESATITVTHDGDTTPLEIENEKTSIEATLNSNSGKWTAEIPEGFLSGLEDKTYAVKAKIADNAGNTSDMTLFRIDVDDVEPTLENLSITNTSTKYSVYKLTTETETYFVNNSDDNKFSILGAVQDAKSGIAKVELFEGEGDTISATPLKSASSLPISEIDFSSLNGSAKLTLKATDNAGNEKTQTIVVNVDNAAPKGIHAIDGKNKDIFFRIGGSDNDDTEITTTGENPLWNDDIDKDVGGKYSNESYSRTQTIRVRGAMDDAGSGVSMIYYKVINSTSELTQEGETGLIATANKFLEDYESDNNGYFRANRESKKRVTYTSADGKVYDTNGDSVLLSDTIFTGYVESESFGSITGKKYATITTNYDNSFTGFEDGYNYLFLVAVDNVGNAGLDTVKIVQGTEKVAYSNFSLNVDTVAPTLESELTATQLTNCETDFDVSGTFEDNASGVKTIVLDIINDSTSAIVKKITLKNGSDGWTETGLEGGWKATIPVTDTTKFPKGTTATYTVKATITDAAGNPDSSNIFGIQIDTVDPSFENVKLATTSTAYHVYRPDENEDVYYVNPDEGTFSISGVATDDYRVGTVKLEIGDGDVKITKTSTNASFNFIDLNLSGFTGTTSTTAKLTVTDTAGNSVSKNITINFDKAGPSWVAADFKVNDAAFNTAENAENWYKDSLLSFAGAYTDDHSEIEKVTYTITPAGEGTQVTGTFSTTKGEGTKETFTTNLKGFVDKKGVNGEIYNLVKLTAYDKVGNPATEQEFKIYIDTTAPTLKSNIKTTKLTNGTADIPVSGTFSDNASGVKSIVLEVLDDDKNVVENGTINVTGFTGNEWSTSISKNILPGDSSASRSVRATITDNAGNPASSTIFNIQIDKEAPVFKTAVLAVVEPEEPETATYKVYKPDENKDEYYVNPTVDKFKISGVATDNYGVAKVEISGIDGIEPSDNGSFDFTELDLSSLTGTSVVATLTAYDEAENSVSKNITINFDTTGPSPVDNDFTIGGKNVGETNWFKDSRLTFAGTYSEAGSGIEQIQYTIIKAGTDDTQKQTGSFGTTVLTGGKESFSQSLGDFIEKAANATSGQIYNTVKLVAVDKVGNKSSETVSAIYIDTTAPDATSIESETPYTNGTGEGTLPIISGTVSDANAGLSSVVIKVNDKEISESTNGNLTLTKTGTEGEGENAVTYNEKLWKWEVAIKHSVFSDVPANTASKNFSVTAVVTDNAGNRQEVPVGNVIADKVAPIVELKAPTDRDTDEAGTQINGTISLEGTISDKNVLPDTAITGIRYNTSSATLANTSADWKELSSVEEITLGLSGNYTFTVTGFDTTKLADETYYIQAVARDSAGNTGYSSAQTVIISQDTDRPKVNITNLVKNDELGYLLQYGTNSQVNGDIYDDDSNAKTVVKEFYITEYPVTAKPTTTDGEISYTFEEEGTGDSFTDGKREAVNCSIDYKDSTGKFIFRPSTAADGQKHFYICIVDNDDKVFYTTYEAPAGTAENKKYLQNPKILINSNRPTKKENIIDESVNTQQFSYTSDSHSPEVSSGKGLPYDSGKNVVTGFDFGTDTSNLGASFGAGGTKRKFVKLQFSAKDSSGIAGMSLELLKGSESLKKLATAEKIAGVEVVTDSNGYSVDVGVGKGEFSGTQNDTPAIWTTDYIDVSGWEKGQISVKVTAYDRIGLSATGSYSFVVDNSAPVIKVNSPVSGTKHTGAVTIGGSANDDGDAGTDSIKWHVLSVAEQTALTGKTASEKETYLRGLTWNEYLSTDSDVTVNNWKFVFDKKLSDLTETEKGNLKFEKYNPMFDLFDTSAYGTAVEGYYPLKVYFMAEDKYGNFTIEENYVIHHDSDGDRPRASFTYPNKDNYDEKTDGDGHEEYVTLGGAIRLQGTATIPNAQAAATVEHVYIQLVHADDTNFDKAYAVGLYGASVLNVQDVLKAVYGNEQGATKYTSITSAIATIENTNADENAKATAYALLKQYGFYSPDEVDSWWGIKTSGTVSWSHAINASNELNPTTVGTTNNIKIRACGVNSEGKFGAWSSGDDLIRINVDSSVPRISAELCQLDSLPSSLPSTTVSPTTYTDGINLRGQWYLVLTILDESGLHSTTPYNISSKSEWTTKDFVFNQNSDKGKKVYVQLTTASGSHSYTVKATDTDNKSVTQTFTVNIDNSAPTLSNIKANGSLLTGTQTISDSDYVFDLSGEAEDGGVGVERVVFYYMRDSGTKTGITDAQKKIYDPMIHATANADGSITYGSVDMPSSFTNVASGGIDLLKIEQDPNTTSTKHKLYARKLTGTSTTDTFTYDTGFDAHVRVGGLIYIDNQYRRITEIDDDNTENDAVKKVVTFSPAKSAGADSDTAWFPIAQVIDSEMSEEVSSFNTDPFTFKKNDGKDKDDGDKMPETFTTNGNTTRNWSAKIHSSNLPDGPISLVILAFDKAGNVNSTTITTTVSNNAPRVAKLFLATDLNDNTKFENDEFESYSLIGAEGTAQDNYVLDFNALDKDNNKKFSAGVFTAKNKLAVVPEIVGGNGAISLVAKKEDAGTTEATARPKAREENDTTTVIGTEIPSIASRVATATDAAALKPANSSITANIFAAETKGNKFYAYVLDNAFLSGISAFETNKATPAGKTTNKGADGENKPFSFTFWDSTDLMTQGMDSQKAVILVKNLTLELTDDTKPTVVVNPFYWKDLNSNSVYGSSESTVKLTSDLKGHIELENDIKNISPITSTLGDDPKVSGKITFTGTAYDEKALKSLSFTFSNGKTGADAVTPFNNVTMATYNENTASWTPATSAIEGTNAAGYVVTVEDARVDNKGNLNYYGVFDDDVYFGQKGHKIYWTLSIDTEKLSTAAAQNMVLKVLATDLAGNTTVLKTNASDTTDTAVVLPVTAGGYLPGDEITESKYYRVTDGTTNKPTYQMDVVPYITGITTELSAGNNRYPTVLSRSALGVYPVRRASSADDKDKSYITVEGFNLKGKDTGITIAGTSFATENDSTTNAVKVNIVSTSTITGGGLVATVGTVSSLNNETLKQVTSVVDGKSVTRKIEYNYEENGQNNDKLTNERQLHIVDVYTTTNTEDKRNLDMAISGNTINFSAGYMDSFFSTMKDASGTSVGTINNLRNSYTRYFDNAIAINESGTIFTVSACGDTLHTPVAKWTNGPSHLALSKGDFDVASGSLNEYYGDSSDNSKLLFLDSNWNGSSLNNLDRFKWPNIVVTGADANTKGYISYYDTTQKLIKFRYFTSTATKIATNLESYCEGAEAKQFVEGAVNTNATYSQGYTAIAGADENSPYSAVGRIKKTGSTNDTAIVAWYDTNSGALKMRYNDNPAGSFSGYQEIKGFNLYSYISEGQNYTFRYDDYFGYYYSDNIRNGNQGGKYVKIGQNYYILKYIGSAQNIYYYTFEGYTGTNQQNSALYNKVNLPLSISFDISVDGQTAIPISIDCSAPSGGNTYHELAYKINEKLVNGHGAYAEVDPKSNLVTVRSMQTGTGSTIKIENLKQGETKLTDSTYLNTAVKGSGSAWTEVTIDDASAGQYVAMETDSHGGIHFAYYDTANGDLKYAYIPDLTAITTDSKGKITSGATVVTVDGYQQVGQYVDLALKENKNASGNKVSVTPFISYYSMSNADTRRAAKVAKLASPIVYGETANIQAGSDNEMFTGAWETFHVPTKGSPVQYRVNIGLKTNGEVYISYLVDRTIEYVKVE